MKKYQFIIDLKDSVTGPLKAVRKTLRGVSATAKDTGEKVKGIGEESEKSVEKVKRSFSGVPAVLAGAFAVDQVIGFGREVVNTLASFERYEAVLTNTLGSSSAAQKALEDITDFASSTPFQVDELSASFVKLANMNFTPSMTEMQKLGDLAASTGKGFDQLAEAVLDASTLEFERLKDFGIRAKKEGDKVAFTFKGQTTQVEANEKAIRQYILSLGDAVGVQGSMSAIASTTGGRLSNLQDRFTGLKLQIGKGLVPVISLGIDFLSTFIGSLSDLYTWTQANTGVVKAVGLALVFMNTQLIIGFARSVALKGATLAYHAVMMLVNGALNAAKVATLAYHGVLLALNTVLGIVRVAAMLFNVVLLANPIGLVVAAVAALVALFAALAKKFPAIGEGLTVFFEWVKTIFTKARDFVYDRFIKPVLGWIDTVASAIGFGSEQPINPIDPKAKDELGYLQKGLQGIKNIGLDIGQPKDQKTASQIELPSANIKGVKIPMQSTNEPTPQSTTVSGEQAQQPKVFNVNIGALVENFNIHSTTIKEATTQVRAEIERALLEAVNNVSHVQ